MKNLEKDERAWLERAENGLEMFAQAVKEKEESNMIDFTNKASGEIRYVPHRKGAAAEDEEYKLGNKKFQTVLNTLDR
jgi:hypothetical protein